MTKEDLIKSISADTNISKESTTEILESFMQCVKSAIAEGDEVTLRGFGTFQNVWRKEKNFHPAPGKPVIYIPGHNEVKLKYSKDVINVIKK